MHVGSDNLTGMYTLDAALILILKRDTSPHLTFFLKRIQKRTYGAILLIQICFKTREKGNNARE